MVESVDLQRLTFFALGRKTDEIVSVDLRKKSSAKLGSAHYFHSPCVVSCFLYPNDVFDSLKIALES